MEVLKRFAASIAAFVKKHRKIITGAFVYHISSWLYDNPVWMAVEYRWHEDGVIAMMIGAFIINSVLLLFFQNRRTDFILWSALDELSERERELREAYAKWGEKMTLWRLIVIIATYIPAKMMFLLLWCLKKSPLLGNIAGFLILPIIEDPFITTMYLRHGYRNGLRGRDIAIYLASSILSIGYWALRNGAIVELVIRPALNLF